MNRTLKRNVAIGAAGLAAVTGGGAAYGAATGSTDHRAAFLNDVAKRLNVTPDKLRSALQGAATDQLDQAVKDGKLTQAQADQLKARVKAHGGLPPFGGPGPGGLRGGPGGPGGFRGGPGGPGPFRGGPGAGRPGPGIDAAATYLGLTADKLHAQLDGGKSLADVAKAQGKSLDGLKQTLIDAAKAKLDQAVKDGHLTAGERDAMLARLKAHIGDIVTGKELGGRGPGGPRGFGEPPLLHRSR